MIFVLVFLAHGAGWGLWRDGRYLAVAGVALVLAACPSPLPGIAALLTAWNVALPFVAMTCAGFAWQAGKAETAIGWLRRTQGLVASRDQWVICLVAEGGIQSCSGNTAPALAMAARLRTLLSLWPRMDRRVVACVADFYVNGGRYRDAVDVVDSQCPPLLLGESLGSEQEYVQVQVNALEALINLGRSEEAWRRLRTLRESVRPSAGAWIDLQEAWMLAREGRADGALGLLEGIRVSSWSGIHPWYGAEVEYCRAMALASAGRWTDARIAVERGRGLSKRASSRRNGAFLLGECAAGEGKMEEAVRWFAEGVADVYRGQGGEALLRYGDVLSRLGRTSDARAAWGLVLERDPESAAVSIARVRLEAGPAGDGSPSKSGQAEREVSDPGGDATQRD